VRLACLTDLAAKAGAEALARVFDTRVSRSRRSQAREAVRECVHNSGKRVHYLSVKFGHAAVREARAHLAELLDDAERGNVTFVTRHGRAVAAIAPAALLERFGQALGALPPTMDGAVDLAWRTEDGSTVFAQVKVYSGRPDQPERAEKDGHAVTPPASIGDAAVVMGPTGSGKSAVIAQIIERCLRAGQPIVLLDPSGEYMRSVADAGAGRDPQPDEVARPTPPEARME
jgi:prevent-host-death family protein